MINEEKLVKLLEKMLKGNVNKEYSIATHENLLYKIIIDHEYKLEPEDYLKPQRGSFAFQTDILIKKDKIPLLVIETKLRDLSTHDILTYSLKAQKHKEIYPYLRYGLVIGNIQKIPNRFFTHNSGFDFALAISDLKSKEDQELFIKTVIKQLSCAEELLSIMENKIKCFSTTIETS